MTCPRRPHVSPRGKVDVVPAAHTDLGNALAFAVGQQHGKVLVELAEKVLKVPPRFRLGVLQQHRLHDGYGEKGAKNPLVSRANQRMIRPTARTRAVEARFREALFA